MILGAHGLFVFAQVLTNNDSLLCEKEENVEYPTEGTDYNGQSKAKTRMPIGRVLLIDKCDLRAD